MLIHHITDLHVPNDGDGRYQEVKDNVLKMMSCIDADPPDLLVITGDLTMVDGSREGCLWIRNHLPSHVDYIVIPGNHDNPQVLSEVFDNQYQSAEDFCFSICMDQVDLLFVNTHEDRLPARQLEFIRQQGQLDHPILFIHHPPDLITDGFMARNQPLEGYLEVSEAIAASNISDVFCGHYHNAIDKDCQNFRLHLTPSPAFQIRLDSAEFQFEEFKPAIRFIDISNEQVETSLHYL